MLCVDGRLGHVSAREQKEGWVGGAYQGKPFRRDEKLSYILAVRVTVGGVDGRVTS